MADHHISIQMAITVGLKKTAHVQREISHMTGELLIAYHAFKFPIKNARLRKLCGAQLFGASCEKTWSYPLVVITGWLVVWNRILFFHILGIIIPTDELIFFRGVGIPPTSS